MFLQSTTFVTHGPDKKAAGNSNNKYSSLCNLIFLLDDLDWFALFEEFELIVAHQISLCVSFAVTLVS